MLDHVTTRSNSPEFALFCGCNTLLVHCFFFFFLIEVLDEKLLEMLVNNTF